MLTPTQLLALDRITQAAVQCENQTGCPAELSAAQCILESAWLTVCPGCNCFGIKATDSHVTYQQTKEFFNGQWVTIRAAFEAYDSLADCFIAHAKLIQSGRYAPFWQMYTQDHDLDKLIQGIAGIYATDPHYAAEVLQLAHGANVAAAIRKARAAAATTEAV